MSKTINPFGKDIISVETDFCGRKLTLETGRVAFQADGAVIVRYGDTVILGIASVADEPTEGMDYFPLMVDYEEKMYAAGKISGSRFIKREGRPSNRAILTSRLIDRPIRPLFPKGYHNSVQVLTDVLALDPELKPDIVAMIAASSALMLTGAPFAGPIGGVRVGLIDEKLVTYPKTSDLEKSRLDLIVAGTGEAIMMVEAGANEVSEDVLIDALEIAHKAIQPVIKLQNELVKKVGVAKREYRLIEVEESITKAVDEFVAGKLGDKVRGPNKLVRDQKIDVLRQAMLEKLVGEDEDKQPYLEAFETALKHEVRRAILEEGIRPDERGPEDVRPLSSEVGVLPQVHGSSLFTRGETQALNVVTLAPPSYAMTIDNMEEDREQLFMHHYNMPGFTVGEIRPMRGPGRREIGHGALAERAILPEIPSQEDFPYTIRAVSEILSSNGSTSMASVCSATLSLMDAGVPIKAPVSGIAMGLMSDGDKFVVLSDIQGAEDFAGDMDFKVAGTAKGVNALQMDIKLQGVSRTILNQALKQAKAGRAHILKSMLATLSEPRKQLAPNVPRVRTINVNPEKVRDIIGKGGETINKIIDDTGAEIDIKDGGIVLVSAKDKASIEAAVDWIKQLTEEPEIGKIYNGTVVKVLDFGAFVEFLPGQDGLVHISELADRRVEKVTDVVKEGDKVKVKLIAIDDQGRMNLSLKQAKTKE